MSRWRPPNANHRQLAEELKKEVDKIDSSEVLSLGLLRRAEEIEKLARHIKTLARG